MVSYKQRLMGYEISLRLAWDELDKMAKPSKCAVSLLGDDYEIRFDERTVLMMPSLIPAGQMESVLILHYLIYILNRDFCPTGEWISFKEAKGGNVFWPAFQESAIKPLMKCFEEDPNKTARILAEHFKGRTVEGGDVAVEVATFPEVFIRMIFWSGEDGLPPAATMLFDQALLEMYCTEDVAVLLMHMVSEVENIVSKNKKP